MAEYEAEAVRVWRIMEAINTLESEAERIEDEVEAEVLWRAARNLTACAGVGRLHDQVGRA